MQAALVQTRLQAKPVSAVRASRAPVVTVKAQKVVSMGLMGTKAGMTTFFTANGDALPCTVIALEDGNVVSQVKTVETDGYSAVQVAYQPMKAKNAKKPEMGHLKKAGIETPMRHVIEYRMDKVEGFQPGQALDASALFKEGDLIDVQGTSIGKGFAGGIKRWNMHRGLMTHGSKSHRTPGSIGMRYSGDGGRVMPGLRMPGHLGAETVTVRKLTILKVDLEKRAIVIKGSVPGKVGGVLRITPAKTVGVNSNSHM